MKEEVFVFTVGTFPYEEQKFSRFQRRNFPIECKDDDIVKVTRTPKWTRLTFMKAKTYERFHSEAHFFQFVLPREPRQKPQESPLQEMLV